MAWVTLIFAGLFEIAWVVGLKQTAGFTRLWPSLFTAAALGASTLLLAMAVRTLPLGVAYSVWTGIGAAGAVIVGAILFKEPASAARLACVGLIIAGVLGLKLTGES